MNAPTRPHAHPSARAMQAVDARADPRNVFQRVPFIALIGATREFAADGRARVALPENAALGNVIGGVHGGCVFTLLDVVMASAAVSVHDFRLTVVSLNVDCSFLAPGRGPLVADGEVLEHDEQIAHCRAWVSDGHGAMVARALGSFRYLPLP